jgi:hypothetical protein
MPQSAYYLLLMRPLDKPKARWQLASAYSEPLLQKLQIRRFRWATGSDLVFYLSATGPAFPD